MNEELVVKYMPDIDKCYMEAEIPKLGYVENAKAIARYAAREAITNTIRGMAGEIVAWGIEQCQEHYRGGGIISRRECPLCWQSLRTEFGVDK